MTVNEGLQERVPETTWDHCVSWAALVTRWRVEETADDAVAEEWHVTLTGADHHLVHLLLAAAIHERTAALGLEGAAVAQVPLAAPGGEGVTWTLQRRAYQALKEAPVANGQGSVERAELLKYGQSAQPDERGVWERVRRLCQQIAVATAGAVAGPAYWEQTVTLDTVRTVQLGKAHR
ncbi:hypothetical protein [Streptomyces sp. H27-D2]|uniref:hypothetical protein n=1 Tax=Streptomyces sp. H27-D2 TaxID=3046304 RepID=UPI002DBCA5B1|nr:hypothetical protein [Streptomyces sp. H27-D2]MEC4015476.1 hypothetical protein [Streptomyces sp. H27-D2]